jgi:large subunit ribosomal protein L16
MTSGLLKVAQFNANIFFIKRKLKILGKIFLRISFSSQFTKKPIGVRMGKGKGALSDFFIKVNQGQLFFEFYKSDFESLKTKNEIYEHLNMVVTKVSNKSHIKLRLMSVDF